MTQLSTLRTATTHHLQHTSDIEGKANFCKCEIQFLKAITKWRLNIFPIINTTQTQTNITRSCVRHKH